ncbi:MAG: hypothetical protein HOV81_03110 [Kofleriaceae bacterium]|nr:hypothetical protein [Kofleriaceae bacterium]
MRLLLLLAASGCAVGGVDEPSGTSASQLGDSADAAIQLEGGGLWYRRVSCPSPSPATCIDEGHFWVDLAIRNDAYAKRVGIVWTDRVRHTPWQLATGVYEAPLADGFERWGVDVTTGTMTGIEPHPQIQLAAFVEMAGETHWDNNNGADYTLE